MTSRRLLLTQELLLPSLQAGYIQHREQEARRIVFCRWIEEEDTKGISGKPPCRQASTATTGTEKSEATVHTTLSTIPEVNNSRRTRADIMASQEHGGRKKQDRSKEGERARQWMFEGKVIGFLRVVSNCVLSSKAASCSVSTTRREAGVVSSSPWELPCWPSPRQGSGQCYRVLRC